MTASAWRHRVLVCGVAALLMVGTAATVGPATAVASTPTASEVATDIQLIFQLINRERSWHGRPALKWSARLASAAHTHNLKEAGADTLSHRLVGEASLGVRISATGYEWSAIGENIGCTPDWTQTGVLSLHKIFYREVAPNDIHRRNILSRTFRHVGVDLYMDATHHIAWLTEDFAAPS